jgi:ectoine hydroxylase-related dioxygenase (phytanoyl-CoA dioxygenase family)
MRIDISDVFYPLGLISKDDVGAFYKDGYLIVRGAFDPTKLQEMRQACENLTAKGIAAQRECSAHTQDSVQCAIYQDTSKLVYRTGQQGQLALSHIVGCGGIAPELLNHLRSTALIHSFANLMGHYQLQHLLCQFHPKLPGSGIVFKPHRDIKHRINYARKAGGAWSDLNGEGSYVVGIIAVDPMDQLNGGLCAIAGSHRPKVDIDNDTLACQDPTYLRQHTDFRALDLESGDIVFLHPYLLHWSGQNKATQRTRYTLITGYSLAGANPNQNPLDYAGDCTHYLIEATPTGHTLEEAPWRKHTTTA